MSAWQIFLMVSVSVYILFLIYLYAKDKKRVLGFAIVLLVLFDVGYILVLVNHLLMGKVF